MDETIKLVIDKFISSYKLDTNVLGIILVGSYAKGKPDPNSDIDIYIILEHSDYRERGNTWIKHLEIEYFINPISQVHNYMETESKYRPHTLDMLANSILLYEKEDQTKISDLIEKSKNELANQNPPLTALDIELYKYTIDDLQKDLIDVHSNKNKIGFQLISNKIINLATEILIKSNRKYFKKLKLIPEQLNTLDPKFFELLSKVMDKNNLDNNNELISYIEKLLGGKRSKEWSMRSELTI